MPNLEDALKKYDQNSSTEEIIQGLQNGGFSFGLHKPTEQPIFQQYLISLLNSKSSKELAISLCDLKKEIENFSKSTAESAKTLNFLTGILAFAAIALVIATVITLFK